MSLRAFWVARIHLGLGRFRLTRVATDTAVPRPLRVRVHPLLGLPPLQSSRPYPTGPPRARDEHLPWGFAPPSRHQSSESTHGRGPTPPTFRPRRFARPRRVTPLCSLPACFIRLPRPRFPLQGFLPAGQRAGLVTRRCPLVVAGVRLRPSCLARSSSHRLAFRALIRPSISCFPEVG
jgi:hypothetical protein